MLAMYFKPHCRSRQLLGTCVRYTLPKCLTSVLSAHPTWSEGILAAFRRFMGRFPVESAGC